MSNLKKLEQAFANWPITNKFWQTSDGKCFFTEPRAIGHAQKLDDKSVKPFSRLSLQTASVKKEVEVAPVDSNKEPIAQGNKPVEKTTKKNK